jgi:peptide/nickel transport system permease protein
VARHLVLPALTLALFYMAVYARMTRAAMLEVAQMDFVKTARAKGVRPGRILRAHVLRNALLPVVTLAGIQAGGMIGGAVLTETVFAWPGIGSQIADSVTDRDLPVILGFTLVVVIAFGLINLLVDLSYAWFDPRIRLGESKS